MPEASPAEDIRLVIWDLDETFWQGTLTEGGIEYIDAHHEIVIELARRGIMSSICSKNDLEPVKQILVEKGLWDYFIFPSINWEPKGQRIAAILQAVQLRATTAIFIDDNAGNRNEARHFVPDLQVADDMIIARVLNDPRFKGKIDSDLSRLKHYKLLERRRTEMSQHGDNISFLRASNIKVKIENDVEAHLDRAIELINRTNQLNFTKQRLSENSEMAKAQLIKQLREPNTQAGLVHVADNYGDYGFVGFYLLKVHTWHLLHFCFSCRTIGLGVERWLYQQLRAPTLRVVGEVQIDVTAGAPVTDWINTNLDGTLGKDDESLGTIFVRGGCEMQAIAHYFALSARDVKTEFPFDRNGLPIVINHSVFLRAAFDALSERELVAAGSLGYERSDFESKIFSNDKSSMYVLSFWADGLYALYGDKEGLVTLPFGIPGVNNGSDIRQDDAEAIECMIGAPGIRSKLDVLKRDFEYLSWSLGLMDEQGVSLYEHNLRIILGALPGDSNIFLLLGCEQVFDQHADPIPIFHFRELNQLTRRATSGMPNVYLIDPLQFVSETSDIIDASHFDRRVYYRIYQRIIEIHRTKQIPPSTERIEAATNP